MSIDQTMTHLRDGPIALKRYRCVRWDHQTAVHATVDAQHDRMTKEGLVTGCQR